MENGQLEHVSQFFSWRSKDEEKKAAEDCLLYTLLTAMVVVASVREMCVVGGVPRLA